MNYFPKERKILEAALMMFTRYGFKKTNISDIAREARIGKGTIYSYFKNKEALFGEVCEWKLDEQEIVFNQALIKYRSKNDPLIDYFIVRNLETKKLIANYRMSQETFNEFVSIFRSSPQKVKKILNDYFELLVKGAKAGRYKPADHWKQALFLYDFNSQYISKWMKTPGEEMALEIKNTVGVVMRGILA